jgi:hypothetical protein
MAVIVREDAGRFEEQTGTSSLKAYGTLVTLAVSVTIGQRPEIWAESGGRVTRLGLCYAGRTERGIEFTEQRRISGIFLLVSKAEHNSERLAIRHGAAIT